MTSTFQPRSPDYAGGSLVNLMAHIESALTGAASAPLLHPDIAADIPEANTFVLMLMDGLGAHQLAHPAAASLNDALVATLHAPFPTTTTVSLSTIATGLTPIEHGLLGHLIWLADHQIVVNSLKWTLRGGAPSGIDTTKFLPGPNLWERLASADIEPITIQPGNFLDTPLSKALYRGCRFEPIWNNDEFARAILDLSTGDRRLIFGYLPDVDFAAHLFGQESREYAEAVRSVATTWETIARRLPPGVVMIGTADHGHLDYAHEDKFFVERPKDVTLFGDPRALYAKGDPNAIASVGEALPARWFDRADIGDWWGPHSARPEVAERMPDGVFLADPGRVLIPGNMDKRLIGYHGGLDPREVEIPLLVSRGS